MSGPLSSTLGKMCPDLYAKHATYTLERKCDLSMLQLLSNWHFKLSYHRCYPPNSTVSIKKHLRKYLSLYLTTKKVITT